MNNTTLLLEGIVGSTAYGLAHAGSDIDKKGIFAFDTKDLFTLNYNKLKEVHETHAPEPDVTHYEAAKWCNLALKCNPNILELVYLPNDLYTVKTDLGNFLIEIRKSFLSAGAVRSAYINYARSQLHEIEERGDFGSDMKKRTEKHARHLVRLMLQGYELYTTGNLTVRLDDIMAGFVKHVGIKTGEGDVALLRSVYEQCKEAFDTSKSVLPDQPDRGTVESWLRYVRERLLK